MCFLVFHRISLIRNCEKLPTQDHFIVQEYLDKPFLMEGYKFDLRIYILVTSCDPLRIFLYNDGLVRMGTEKYHAPSDANLVSRRLASCIQGVCGTFAKHTPCEHERLHSSAHTHSHTPDVCKSSLCFSPAPAELKSVTTRKLTHAHTLPHTHTNTHTETTPFEISGLVLHPN